MVVAGVPGEERLPARDTRDEQAFSNSTLLSFNPNVRPWSILRRFADGSRISDRRA